MKILVISKKQRNKLILVNHPDKGGDKNRFDWIYKAHKELKEYIIAFPKLNNKLQ